MQLVKPSQISKATNAIVEAGLVTCTIILAAFGLPLVTLAVMVGVGIMWWFFVQVPRLKIIWADSPFRMIGAIGIASTALGIGHALGFGIGAALHSSLRL